MGGFAVLGLRRNRCHDHRLVWLGTPVRSLAGLPNGTWPLTAALGMASQLFLGGLLNLCHLAYPAAFAVLTVGGLAMTAQVLWRHGSWRLKMPSPYGLPWSVLVVGLCGFVSATQLKPRLSIPTTILKFFPACRAHGGNGHAVWQPPQCSGRRRLWGRLSFRALSPDFFPCPSSMPPTRCSVFFCALRWREALLFGAMLPGPLRLRPRSRSSSSTRNM